MYNLMYHKESIYCKLELYNMDKNSCGSIDVHCHDSRPWNMLKQTEEPVMCPSLKWVYIN